MVEDEFVRRLYLGGTVLPFRTLTPKLAVIPLEGSRLLNGTDEPSTSTPAWPPGGVKPNTPGAPTGPATVSNSLNDSTTTVASPSNSASFRIGSPTAQAVCTWPPPASMTRRA